MNNVMRDSEPGVFWEHLKVLGGICRNDDHTWRRHGSDHLCIVGALLCDTLRGMLLWTGTKRGHYSYTT